MDAPAILYQKDCHWAGEERNSGPCPEGSYFYFDRCYEIGLKSMKFHEAEVACLPDVGEEGRYDSRLVYSDQHHVLDYLSVLIDQEVGKDAYWVGLDDRNWEYDGTTAYETSTGETRSLTDPIWLTDGNGDGTKYCGALPDPNGGFVVPDICTKSKAYACMSAPRYNPPDNLCPRDFFPYKSDCLMPVRLPGVNYTDAQLACASRGSALFAAREPGEFEVVKEYAANEIKGDVWMGARTFSTTYVYDEYSGGRTPLIIVEEDGVKSYADGTAYSDDTE